VSGLPHAFLYWHLSIARRTFLPLFDPLWLVYISPPCFEISFPFFFVVSLFFCCPCHFLPSGKAHDGLLPAFNGLRKRVYPQRRRCWSFPPLNFSSYSSPSNLCLYEVTY